MINLRVFFPRFPLVNLGRKSYSSFVGVKINLACFIFLLFCSKAVFSMPPFFMSSEGSFVEQMHSGSDYTVVHDYPDQAFQLINQTGDFHHISPDHKLSFGGRMGFKLPQHWIMELSFFIHNHSFDDAISANQPTRDLSLGGNAAYFSGGSERPVFAQSSLFTNIQTVDIKIGHTLLFKESFSTHPYVGVDLSYLKVRQTAAYSFENQTRNVVTDESSSITGVGPLIGTRLNYAMTPSFGLGSDISFSIITGISRSLLYANTPLSLGTPNPIYVKKRVRHNFEKIDMKMGISYKKRMSTLSNFQVKAGYHIVKYIRGILSDSYPDSGSNSFNLTLLEDAGFQGPFISLGFSMG